MPTLNIKDPEVYRLARALADRQGTSMTRAIRQALEASLGRTAPVSRAGVAERILEVARRSREVHGTEGFLTDDDLYDDRGLPR